MNNTASLVLWREKPTDRRDARAAANRKRLIQAGAALQELPSGAIRVVQGSDFMVTANLADLTPQDVDRLCRT